MSEEKIEAIYLKLSEFYLALPKELKKILEKATSGNVINMDRMKIVHDYLEAYEEMDLLERLGKAGFVGLFTYLRVAIETKKQFAFTKEYEGDNEEAFCSSLELETEMFKGLAQFLGLPNQMTVADVLTEETPFHRKEEADRYLDQFTKFFDEMDEPLHENSDSSTPEGVENVKKLMDLLKTKYRCE